MCFLGSMNMASAAFSASNNLVSDDFSIVSLRHLQTNITAVTNTTKTNLTSSNITTNTTEKKEEIVQAKAIYPTDIIFKKNDIVMGGSALFVIGKCFYD